MLLHPFLINSQIINNLDDSGIINVYDNLQNYDFICKRCYFVNTHSKSIKRGFHAHINLNQILICVNGVCSIDLISKKNEKYSYTLDSKNVALFIPANYWREYILQKKTTIAVLADNKFRQDDYIHNFEEFIKS